MNDRVSSAPILPRSAEEGTSGYGAVASSYGFGVGGVPNDDARESKTQRKAGFAGFTSTMGASPVVKSLGVLSIFALGAVVGTLGSRTSAGVGVEIKVRSSGFQARNKTLPMNVPRCDCMRHGAHAVSESVARGTDRITDHYWAFNRVFFSLPYLVVFAPSLTRPSPPSPFSSQTANLGSSPLVTRAPLTPHSAGDTPPADGATQTPKTVVFPGLGTPEENLEFSDQLSEGDLREERTEARKMARHRERLEEMRLDTGHEAPKEGVKETEKPAEKAPEKPAEKPAAKPADTKPDTKPAAKDKDTPGAGAPALEDYEPMPAYADAPYGDEGAGGAGKEAGPGSIADLLKLMNEQAGDPRVEVHAPSAAVSRDNAELLRRVAEDKPVDPNGEKEMGYLRYPNVVGKVVTFVSEGNIWVGSIDGGAAARVSASYSAEALPKLSPDGKQIAFLAQSVDGYEVFTVPVAGGITTRVSYGSAAMKLEGWTKKGKVRAFPTHHIPPLRLPIPRLTLSFLSSQILIVTTFFSPTGLPQLAEIDTHTKNMAVLPFARATGGIQDEHGCYVFYPLRQTSSTKRYEGGEQSRLWRWCASDKEASILTDEAWTKRGSWSPVTTPAMPYTIFFLSDKSGVTNIWSMKLDGSDKQQITTECGMDVMEFDLDVAADEHGAVTGVARVGGSLRSFVVARSGPKKDGPPALQGAGLRKIPITLVSEFRESSIGKLRYPLEELREVSLSEDGMYAALVIRGQIFFTPLLEQLGSRIEQVTGGDGAVRYRHVQFVRSEHEEDNSKLLAMSDASGEYEYVLLERRAGAEMGGLWGETQLTFGGQIKGVMSYSQVSPDGTSLVFDDTNGRISVLNLTKTAVNTFGFKTTPDEKMEPGASSDDVLAQMARMMQGGGGSGGGLGAISHGTTARVTPLGAPRALAGTTGGGLPVPTDDDDASQDDPSKSVRARERSKLRRKRRAFRRETRSEFRRDWRLAHALPRSGSGQSITSSPRSFPGFEQNEHTNPKAKGTYWAFPKSRPPCLPIQD